MICHYTILVSIMLFAGVFGGAVNFFLVDHQDTGVSTRYLIWKSLLLGVAASLLVPLFLNTIGSDILKPDGTGNFSPYNYFIFGGFCLLAAIISKRFIEDLYSKIIKVERVANQAKAEATEAKQATKESEVSKQEMDEKALEASLERVAGDAKPLTAAVKDNAKKVIDAIQNSNFVYRTVKGISKDSGLKEEDVQQTLNDLEERHIVSTVLNKRQNKIYKVVVN